MRNMDTGDLTVFKVDNWFSASKGDRKICRDVVAIVKGKTQLRCTFQPFQKHRMLYHGVTGLLSIVNLRCSEQRTHWY